MKILITGAGGMLARDLANELANSCELITKSRAELDICNANKTYKEISALRPDLVINCAAFTQVDDCEKESDRAYAVNANGVRNLALACKNTGSILYHISTDFVFDGKKRQPYKEDDLPNPLSVYGKSKLEGERHIQKILEKYVIIRSSWIFGKWGRNFVSTILNLSKKNRQIYVVNDQRGSPTYTVDLSMAIKALIQSPSQGIYHITNTGSCTWYDFAVKIIEFTKTKTKVIPITSDQIGRAAKRPSFSVLDCSRFFRETEHHIRSWESALKEYLKEK